MEDLKNKLAKAAFGMTAEEAISKGICVDCKNPAFKRCYSERGRDEYQVSGLCELCFDAITSPREEEGGDLDEDEQPAF